MRRLAFRIGVVLIILMNNAQTRLMKGMLPPGQTVPQLFLALKHLSVLQPHLLIAPFIAAILMVGAGLVPLMMGTLILGVQPDAWSPGVTST